MGSTETDHSTRETPAEKLAKAILKSDPKLLAESWIVPQKDTKTASASPAPESTAGAKPKAATTQAGKAEAAPGTPAGSPIKLADANQDSVRRAAVAEDQKLIGGVLQDRQQEAKGTSADGKKVDIKDILNDFDKLEKEAAQWPLASVYNDFKAIKNDPSKQPEASAEASLLHSPATILANKAMVAYDAAFKPDADKGSLNRRQLIDIARQSADTASQDKAVAQTFGSQFKAFEGLVTKYNFAPAIGATGDSTPTPGAPPAATKPGDTTAPTAPAPVEQQPNPAAGHDAPPSPAQTQTDKLTDQDLAKFAQNAASDTPARQQIEQQLWGDSTKDANAQKYLTAKKDMYIILNNMDGYTGQQKEQFQQSLFGTNAAVQDKQNYINQFAAKDQTLHDAATELLKLSGDKLPTVAQWYVKENSNAIACSAFYEKAIQAENAGKTAQATDYWNKAQKYPLESNFASGLVQDQGVLRMDAIQMGQTQDLYNVGLQAEKTGDYKGAAQYFKDSVVASDISYKATVGDAKKQVADAHQKLLNGGNLSSDEKLAIAAGAYPAARALTGPVEARNNAAAALAGLTTDNNGNYVAGPGGQKYPAQIAQWLKDSTAMSKNIDTTAITSIGQTLASAAQGNLTLNQAGHEKDRQTVGMEAQILLGGQLPGTKNKDGSITPGQRLPGTAELPYTTPRILAAFMMTQGHGSDAIAAITESAQREATQKGWSLKDTAAKDPMINQLAALAKPLDSNHILDQLKNNEDQWKTPIQAIGGFVAFSAAAALAHNFAPLIEDAGSGLAVKEGMIGMTARAAIRYAPTLAGVGAAFGTSYAVDRLGTTHDGWQSAAVKGLSVVALVKSGKYLSRVGATGLAPEVADNLFGAGTRGGELSASKVLGRMVVDASSKPLAESELTVGKLAEHYTGKLSPANLAKLSALPQDAPVFEKGVINPKVNEAFLGTSQRNLAQLASEALPKTGAFVPKPSEVAGLLKGAPIDITNGDANVINRQLAVRTRVAGFLGTGTASKATEQGLMQRVAMEVSNTNKVAEGTLTRDQFLDYAKARGVKTKELGQIASVVGEDAPILQGGKLNPSLGTIDSGVQNRLTTIAKDMGKDGELTSQDLVNYANKNKIPLSNFESVLNQDPVLIQNGKWNPNLLIQDAKTGVVTKAVDTPNFKGVMGLDHMKNTQLFSQLSKHGESEKSVLLRIAQRQSQQVVGDGAGNITKAAYVQRLEQAGETAESIAQKYPNLSKINDDDLIVKNGKYQTKVVQRDMPENMTAGQFKDYYMEKTGFNLRDPEVLKNSPWNRALKAVSDDATIMKDGKWQYSRFTFRLPSGDAEKLVNERTINIGKPKGIGLAESNGKYLMKDAKANLSAGQLLAAMKDANLDPESLKTLLKMNPNAPIVVDGKLVKAPVAELSPTSKSFTWNRSKPISLGTSEGQRAVLLGEATDGEVSGLNLRKNWKSIVTSPTKAAGAAYEMGAAPIKYIGSTLSSIGNTIWDTRFGAGVFGSVDPTVGTFARQGSRYGLQNFVGGTFGVAGSYGLYQGLNTSSGENFDANGDRVPASEAFQNSLLGFGNSPDAIKALEDGVRKQYDVDLQALPEAERDAMTKSEYEKNLADRISTAKTKATLKHNFWMPQFYSSYQSAGLPWMNLALTAGLPLASEEITGASAELKGTNANLRVQLNQAQDANKKPLVDNPDLVVPDATQPAPAPGPTSVPTDSTTAAPSAAPPPTNGDDLAPQ